jgi:starch phosphorylase
MKESIISTGGRYSTARMVVDYTQKMYMPLCNLTNKYYNDIENVENYNRWKENVKANFQNIKITQEDNIDNETIDAGKTIKVKCKVQLPDIDSDKIQVEVYYGQIEDNGIMGNVTIIPMVLKESNEEQREFTYEAQVELTTGGDYGYTFRVMPKHEMLLDAENLDLVKWIEK